MSDTYTATRKLTILNMSPFAQNYEFSSQFRYANDAGKGVSVTADPDMVSVAAGQTIVVDVTLTIDLAQSMPTSTIMAGSSFLWGRDITRGHHIGW